MAGASRQKNNKFVLFIPVTARRDHQQSFPQLNNRAIPHVLTKRIACSSHEIGQKPSILSLFLLATWCTRDIYETGHSSGDNNVYMTSH